MREAAAGSLGAGVFGVAAFAGEGDGGGAFDFVAEEEALGEVGDEEVPAVAGGEGGVADFVAVEAGPASGGGGVVPLEVEVGVEVEHGADGAGKEELVGAFAAGVFEARADEDPAAVHGAAGAVVDDDGLSAGAEGGVVGDAQVHRLPERAPVGLWAGTLVGGGVEGEA